MKPNKEKIVQDILIELEKGASYNQTSTVICSKFRFSDRTFAKYWNDANEAYKDTLNKRQKELDALSTDLEKERIKSAILTKFERMEIASTIAKGTPRFSSEQILIPSDSERMKAIDYLSKIDGDYSATKIESEVKIKNDYDLKKLTDTELEQLFELQNKCGNSE